MKTSISDIDDYKDICKLAYENDEVFNSFKQNENYNFVLEHMEQKVGLGYINYIKETKIDLSRLNKFKENDEQGSPIKYIYEEPFGLISPTTLRYVKVLSELEMLFGSLDGKKIVEIGVGYGGQSKMIMDYFNISEYNYVDLPEVLKLTQKYLKKYNYENLNFYSYDNLPDKEYDFIISNYAFTECNRDIQNTYLDRIINKSNMGYITGNYIGQFFNVDTMGKYEIQGKINKKTNFIEEVPLTHQNNYILIWK
jgi:putative sugar O-methyltransferase